MLTSNLVAHSIMDINHQRVCVRDRGFLSFLLPRATFVEEINPWTDYSKGIIYTGHYTLHIEEELCQLSDVWVIVTPYNATVDLSTPTKVIEYFFPHQIRDAKYWEYRQDEFWKEAKLALMRPTHKLTHYAQNLSAANALFPIISSSFYISEDNKFATFYFNLLTKVKSDVLLRRVLSFIKEAQEAKPLSIDSASYLVQRYKLYLDFITNHKKNIPSALTNFVNSQKGSTPKHLDFALYDLLCDLDIKDYSLKNRSLY